jgi:hypothetical protein
MKRLKQAIESAQGIISDQTSNLVFTQDMFNKIDFRPFLTRIEKLTGQKIKITSKKFFPKTQSFLMETDNLKDQAGVLSPYLDNVRVRIRPIGGTGFTIFDDNAMRVEAIVFWKFKEGRGSGNQRLLLQWYEFDTKKWKSGAR